MSSDVRERLVDAIIRHERTLYDGAGGHRCVGCDSLHGDTDGPNSPRHAEHVAAVRAEKRAQQWLRDRADRHRRHLMNAHLLAFLAVVAICVATRIVGMWLGDRAAAEPVRGALPDADEEWLGSLREEGS